MKISDLNFDPANARKHDDKNISAIKASLKRFGQQKPIVIDKNDIVRAGNGTLAAAKALGWKEIDVVKSDLEPSELTAYAIADNRTGEMAEWDDDALAAQLKAMDDELRDIAYDDFEFPEDPIEPGENDDVVPETAENEMGVKLGDIWLLGDHRLMCGDSTDKACVDKLMDGQKADMVFTDPPYGISYSADKLKLKNSAHFKELKNDDGNLDLSFLFQDDVENKVIWGANNFPNILPHRGRWYCWYKRGVGAEKAIGSPFELAWSNQTSGYGRFFKICHGGFVNSDGGKRVHPTQKPTFLAQECFECFKNINLVLDYFLGSGSTLIACEKTNRKCFGMELDPHYCSVIIKRWEEFSGKKASKE
jgi:DNA modification methylase